MTDRQITNGAEIPPYPALLRRTYLVLEIVRWWGLWLLAGYGAGRLTGVSLWVCFPVVAGASLLIGAAGNWLRHEFAVCRLMHENGAPQP